LHDTLVRKFRGKVKRVNSNESKTFLNIHKTW